MGTNPAGIGIYRSNDVMLSFGFDNTRAKSALGQSVSKFHGSFDNAGFVFAAKVSNNGALRFANFGFNYRKIGSFDRSMLTGGTFDVSQLEQAAYMLNIADNGVPIGEDALMADGVFNNPNVPWLGAMGYNAGTTTGGPNHDQSIGLVNPVYVTDAGGKQYLDHYEPYTQVGDQIDQVYRSKESGGLHSFDLNGALNFYDRFYVGATLGLYSINYDRNSAYGENFTGTDGTNYGGYTLSNHYWADGSGVDFKLGFILRPFEDSSFRIGAAVHTPTFFSVTEHGNAVLDYDFDAGISGSTRPYDDNKNDMASAYSYKVVTPWKVNVSLGYTVGTAVALGVEYEYANRSAGTLKDQDGYKLGQSISMNDMMKAVHTLRAGAEIKLAKEFSLRLGYNYITAPFKDDAYKYLQPNSMRTDTEYANIGAMSNYTCGLGYRGKSFYADLAYRYNTYNETFYSSNVVGLPGTKISNNNHKVLLTLGMRF
jgi:hypothetical protein